MNEDLYYDDEDEEEDELDLGARLERLEEYFVRQALEQEAAEELMEANEAYEDDGEDPEEELIAHLLHVQGKAGHDLTTREIERYLEHFDRTGEMPAEAESVAPHDLDNSEQRRAYMSERMQQDSPGDTTYSSAMPEESE